MDSSHNPLILPREGRRPALALSAFGAEPAIVTFTRAGDTLY